MQTVAVTSVQLDCFSNTKLTGSDLTWEHLLERRTSMAAHGGCDTQRHTQSRACAHAHTHTRIHTVNPPPPPRCDHISTAHAQMGLHLAVGRCDRMQK